MYARKLAFALVASFSAALLIGVIARAGDVKEADVPKAVLEAVKKKYPGASLLGFEREEAAGKVSFEVKLEVKQEKKSRRIDVDLAPDGKILCEEEKIAASELPEAVTKGLAASKYAMWTIKKTERVVKDEKDADPSFELVVTDAKQKFEVVFDKAGKLTAEKDMTAKAGAGDHGDHGGDHGGHAASGHG